MSNDSSASETTPLRRPEESYQQLPEDSLSASVTTDLLTSSRNGLSVSVASQHNNSATPTTQLPSDYFQSARSHTVAVANHNNNHIEVRLSQNNRPQHNSGRNRLNPTQANGSSETPVYLIKMDTTNKRILCRVGLDVLILICVLFPILCFFLWGESYKRGFFCDDESLMHPYKDSTINNFWLYMIGLVLPVIVILIVEIIQARHHERVTNGNSTGKRYVFMDYEIPDWLLQAYKKIGVFGFGAAACQLTVDIAKYSVGRLRPHFLEVCNPIMPGNTTCLDSVNMGRYIEDFQCRGGVGVTKRMLKEISLSFPSGHSSFTFYGMVYLAIYLQCRMTWSGSKLLRHLLQFGFVMLAWYTALSRVSDYKHHWSDVLGGSLIGALAATIVAKFISDLFPAKSAKSYILPTCTRDVTPQTTITTTNGN
ncbi:putative phosphatidate phosphatase isoform X1 [Stomoxys calcitrans]|uniref:putative phosphatidate phosphatase isoform X1 n=1 Tax=Stomoxys calcitrans TaxID=35570 RepID=UPI0027E24741|nr:putative phosphatidate phosphatase isoform X1 [Stomoxys calcitrans]